MLEFLVVVPALATYVRVESMPGERSRFQVRLPENGLSTTPRKAPESAKLAQNFFIIREAPRSVLREDQSAIDGDVEHPRIPLDEIGINAELFLDCGRQTGGLGQVASTNAVGDLDVHGSPPLWLRLAWRSRSPAADPLKGRMSYPLPQPTLPLEKTPGRRPRDRDFPRPGPHRMGRCLRVKIPGELYRDYAELGQPGRPGSILLTWPVTRVPLRATQPNDVGDNPWRPDR